MKKIILATIIILGILLMAGIAGQNDCDRYLEADLRNEGKVNKMILFR